VSDTGQIGVAQDNREDVRSRLVFRPSKVDLDGI
jgi:hypothetical protein